MQVGAENLGPIKLGESKLGLITARIAAASRAAGRDPAAVSLLAASKGQTIDAMVRLAAQGQRAFGENYVQEALPKMAALADLNLSWHFIGRLQANKTREIATRFSWVHSVDRPRLAWRLNEQRPDHLPPLDCCIEVNISGEASKSGVVHAHALADLVAAFRPLARLRLRGFMALPALTPDPDLQRAGFRRLRELLASHAGALDTLSMGTSVDYAAAIAEGATIVRIGTALFGPRGRDRPPT
ncbi:MAG: YggS family pyridoxal phosphate-dependent enzyme [Gammaproteobacteria bacterium]